MPLSWASGNKVKKMDAISVTIVNPKEQNEIVQSVSGLFALTQPEQSPKSEQMIISSFWGKQFCQEKILRNIIFLYFAFQHNLKYGCRFWKMTKWRKFMQKREHAHLLWE